MHRISAGARFAHYLILEPVGAGGMGEVYCARDEQLDRDVAVKVLPASAVDDPIARARLVREASSAAALNRSNMWLESSFMATTKLSTRFGLSWQVSHGGLRSTEILGEDQIEQFDRILKDNYFHITGGASYSLPRFDVFMSYIYYASGTDTHGGRAIALGLSWPFER